MEYQLIRSKVVASTVSLVLSVIITVRATAEPEDLAKKLAAVFATCEAEFPAVQIEIHSKQFVKAGAISARIPFISTAPTADTELNHQTSVYFSNTEVRVRDSRQMWSDVSQSFYVDHAEYSYDGKSGKSLHETSAGVHHRGYVDSNGNAALFRNAVWPLVVSYRPMSSGLLEFISDAGNIRNIDLPGGAIGYVITKVEENGVVHRLTLDELGALRERTVQQTKPATVFKTVIDYDEQGHIRGWTDVQHIDNAVVDSAETLVSSTNFGTMDRSIFNLDFPPGTIITDRRESNRKHHLVEQDGSLVDVKPGEIVGAAIEPSQRSTRWILVVFSLVLTSAVAFYASLLRKR